MEREDLVDAWDEGPYGDRARARLASNRAGAQAYLDGLGRMAGELKEKVAVFVHTVKEKYDEYTREATEQSPHHASAPVVAEERSEP